MLYMLDNNSENAKDCCNTALMVLKFLKNDVSKYEKSLENRHSPRKRSMKAFHAEVIAYAEANLAEME